MTDRLRLPASQSPWNSHGPGRLAILRLRGREQLRTKTGRNLFTLLYHEQLASCLLGNGELLSEFPDWMRKEYPRTPLSYMELMVQEISCLCYSFRKTVLRDHPSKGEHLRSLIHKGQLFNDAFDAMDFRDMMHVWPKHDQLVRRALGIDRPRDLP